MTALEKLLADCPEFANGGIDYVVDHLCTDTRGYLDAPKYCPLGMNLSSSEFTNRCRLCWNREILENEKETKVTGCKEIKCTRCAHGLVCGLKEEYLNAQMAVDRVEVPTDDTSFIRLNNIKWIRPVELDCIHFIDKLVTPRYPSNLCDGTAVSTAETHLRG